MVTTRGILPSSVTANFLAFVHPSFCHTSEMVQTLDNSAVHLSKRFLSKQWVALTCMPGIRNCLTPPTALK